MRIVTKIVTVIATIIILASIGWSIYIYNSPLESNSFFSSYSTKNLDYSLMQNYTGNLTLINDTSATITINDTGDVIWVLFEDYNETNVTDFDNKTVVIYGQFYQMCECDTIQAPCIKDIETIAIVDE